MGSSSAEKVLGIQIDNRLHPNQQRVLAARRANHILGFLSKTEAKRSGKVIFPMYSAFVK